MNLPPLAFFFFLVCQAGFHVEVIHSENPLKGSKRERELHAFYMTLKDQCTTVGIAIKTAYKLFCKLSCKLVMKISLFNLSFARPAQE